MPHEVLPSSELWHLLPAPSPSDHDSRRHGGPGWPSVPAKRLARTRAFPLVPADLRGGGREWQPSPRWGGAASGHLCCSWVILMGLASAHGWSHLFCGSAPALGSPLNTPRWASTLMPVSASGAQTETTRPHRPPSLELWEVLPPPFCTRQRLGLCRTDWICILLLCPETSVVGNS